MIPNRYRDAYKEIYTILEYLEENDYNKIPPEVIDAIKNNMNEEYEYYMNEEIDIFKQPMLPETKATLFNIFRDYLSTPEQKEKIIRMQEEERQRNEAKKQEQYKTEELFKNRTKQENILVEETVEMIEYKENLFSKIKNTIRKLLKK